MPMTPEDERTRSRTERTVYVGNLAAHVAEQQLMNFFSVCGPIANVRLAGDPTLPTRFGFVEFLDPMSAQSAMQLNGMELGGRPIKVNPSKTGTTRKDPQQQQQQLMHQQSMMGMQTMMTGGASGGGMQISPETGRPVRVHNPELLARTVHVSGMDPNLTEQHVLSFFNYCGQITNYRFCGDSPTNRFAFIEFSAPEQASMAISLSGSVLGSMQLKVSTSKNTISQQAPASLQHADPGVQETTSRTIHLGNIDASLTEDTIAEFFIQMGPIKKVAIAGDMTQTTRFAFVEFETQEAAREACKLSGTVLGGRSIRVNLSRAPIMTSSAKVYAPGQTVFSGAGAAGKVMDPYQQMYAFYGYPQMGGYMYTPQMWQQWQVQQQQQQQMPQHPAAAAASAQQQQQQSVTRKETPEGDSKIADKSAATSSSSSQKVSSQLEQPPQSATSSELQGSTSNGSANTRKRDRDSGADQKTTDPPTSTTKSTTDGDEQLVPTKRSKVASDSAAATAEEEEQEQEAAAEAGSEDLPSGSSSPHP